MFRTACLAFSVAAAGAGLAAPASADSFIKIGLRPAFAGPGAATAMAAGLTPYPSITFALQIAPDAGMTPVEGFGAPIIANDHSWVAGSVEIGGRMLTARTPENLRLRIIDSDVPGSPDILSLIARPSALPGSPYTDFAELRVDICLDPAFSQDGAQPSDWRALGATCPFGTQAAVSVQITAANGETAQAAGILNYDYAVMN